MPLQVESKPNDATRPTRRVTRGRLFAGGWQALRAALIAYLIVLLWVMAVEDSFIFFPTRYPQGDWQPAGLEFEDVWFQASDGTRLHGWYRRHENPRAVVLFAHGNAGNLSDRAGLLEIMYDRYQASAMLFDYRGYGRSEGQPSERGVLDDARAARRVLAAREGIPEERIVLMGRSLGGAVAVDLATDGARALILQSTFTSMPDVASYHYHWLPTRLMRTQFDSLSKIDRYHGPLLQSHGTADEIIPFELGRRLFDAAPGPKRFVALEGRGHNDPDGPDYWQAVDEFLAQLP